MQVKYSCISVFIFIISLTINLQAQELLGEPIPAASTSDRAGTSISLSADGKTMAIGAPLADENGTSSGEVRIYEWDGFAWSPKGSAIIGLEAMDQFGFSVDLSADGNTVVVGAPYFDDSGQVQIFDWEIDYWVQRGPAIYADGYGDAFGFDVDINADGSIVAIGSPDNGDSGFKGRVKVFEWDFSQWIQRGENFDGSTFGGDFGHSLALNDSGNSLIIGSPLAGTGKVEVFQWNGLSWSPKGVDIDGEESGEKLGHSVSISADGNTILIGSPGHNMNAGKAQSYIWDGQWKMNGHVILGFAENDQLGAAVSLNSDGTVMAIGSPETAEGGSVSTYKWVFGAWTLRGDKIPAEDTFDDFGKAIQLNADGEICAIGAPLANLNSGAGYAFGPCWNAFINSALTSCGPVEIQGEIYNESGIYEITIPNGGNCADLLLLELTILDIISTTIEAEACQIYFQPEWQETFTEGGTYTRVFESSLGCDSLVTLELDLTTIDLQVNINNDELSASAILASNYQWLDCNDNFMSIIGETNQSFFPSEDGSYAVEITKENCIDTSQCIDYIVTSTAQIEKIIEINIYPNPGNGIINIDLGPNYSNATKVEVWNTQGKLILTKEAIQDNTISLSNQPKGIYQIKVSTTNGTLSKRYLLID